MTFSLLVGLHHALTQLAKDPQEKVLGGIIRTDQSKKQICLVFTGHEFADGGVTIRNTLKKHNVRASFFFTGDFYRNPAFDQLIRELIQDGHYLGGHSNKHLLYASWEKRDSLLVTKEEFLQDLSANYQELDRFGISKDSAQFFLPPYEWYNQSISNWCAEWGLTLVNFTPGTYSNADYTYPELGASYLSSDSILARILAYEESHPNGLSGFILLTHIGTDPRRTDKFYDRLDSLLEGLEKKGYKFRLLGETIRK
ncbi:MAG: polysaccharide deacetylase family protein [Bacteroidota bacterium]